MTIAAAPLLQPPFERALRFGRFSLDPSRKLLLDEQGQVVRVGGRALDLLIALVERAGEVVSHEDLFTRVWPHSVVEESSLRVHLSALRKALGESGDARYIASVPGRGYSFVMGVAEAPRADEPVPVAAAIPDRVAHAAPTSTASRPLPSRLNGIIGRHQVLAQLSAKLQRRRLVTLVGPGGIGKTAVALALAEEIAPRHAHGAVFVDLGSLGDPSLVPTALADAMGILAPTQDPWPTLEAALAAHDLLIVLDNCEHVIAASAALAERVLRAAPQVRILATSREPLEAESEAIHRVESLAVPPLDPALDVSDALAFAAVRLFVERATANADDFVLSPANLPAVVRLCHHLDGLPLAIELAAARVGSLGIQALAERLDDVFRLLRRGRRTVLPRHQTLQALLDWSHGLLGAEERRVLQRLSMFRASFLLDTAAELASGDDITRAHAIDCVLSLVSKSLIELEDGDTPRYRLLFVTRIHAGEQLALAGEAAAICRRHAACLRDLLARANAELGVTPLTSSEWTARHALAIPDIRAALDWAESPHGDRLLGAELLAEASRLGLELCMTDEFLQRGMDALDATRTGAALAPVLELRLLALLCMASGQSLPDRPMPADIPQRLDDLSQRLGTTRERKAALQALCINAFGNGDYPRVVERAARLETLESDPAEPSNASLPQSGRRFAALGQHYLGDHLGAWTASAAVLAHAHDAWRAQAAPQLPEQISMGIVQARILWLQGHADRAIDRAMDTLAYTEGPHPFALSQALAMAVIPILLWRGDDSGAAPFVQRLADGALHHCQSFWLAWASGYCTVLALRGHDVDNLRRRIPGSRARPLTIASDMLGTLAPELVGPELVARVEAGTVGWCAPEILRVHGERLRSVPKAPAEATLLRALSLARRQGARAWELRAATSVAALWQSEGRGGEARTLLAGVMAGFDAGRDSADMRRALALLALPAGA